MQFPIIGLIGNLSTPKDELYFDHLNRVVGRIFVTLFDKNTPILIIILCLTF